MLFKESAILNKNKVNRSGCPCPHLWLLGHDDYILKVKKIKETDWKICFYNTEWQITVTIFCLDGIKTHSM